MFYSGTDSVNRVKLVQAQDDEALRHVISNGIQPEMPGAWQLTEHEVVSVAAYVRSLGVVAAEQLPEDAARASTRPKVAPCAT